VKNETIETQTIGDVAVMSALGRLTMGGGDTALKETVRTLLEQGWRKFVLDLEHLTYIDSVGNGEVTRAYTTISRSGGRLILSHPTRRFFDLQVASKLNSVYEMVPSVRDAIDEFQAERHLEAPCPVCGPSSRVRVQLRKVYQSHECGNCGSRDAARLLWKLLWRRNRLLNG
jgi:anti-sigma B factor antagonist